jgi:chromosome segregation ATPase
VDSRHLSRIFSITQTLQIELDSLKAEFDTVSADLLSKEMEIEDLRDLLQNLEEEQRSIENDNRERSLIDSQLKLVQDENDKLKAALEATEKQFTDSQNDEMANLKSELDAKHKAVSDLTAAADALTREKATLASQLETLQMAEKGGDRGNPDLLESLQMELGSAKADYEQAEIERKKALGHLAALGKSLKKAEDSLLAEQNRVFELDETINKLQESLKFVTGERDAALAQSRDLKEQVRESEQDKSNPVDSQKLIEAEQRHAADMQRLTEQCSHLQKEVVRYRELEEFAASELERAEADAQEQAANHLLEIDRLQQEVNRLASHATQDSRSLPSIDAYDRLKADCDRLIGENSQLAEEVASYSSAISEHERYRIEQSSWYEQEFNRLNAATHEIDALRGSCEQLKEEVSGYIMQIAALNQECEALRAASIQRVGRHEDEDNGERRRLVEVLNENEELLIQFGLLKQNMDSSEEYIRTLEAELEGFRSNGRDAIVESNGNSYVAKIAQMEAELRSVVAERNDLANRLHGFNSSNVRNDGSGSTKDLQTLQLTVNELNAQALKQDLVIRNQAAEMERLVDDLDQMRGNRGQFLSEELDNRIRHLEDELERKATIIEQLENAASEFRSKLDEANSEKENYRISMSKDIDTLEDKVKALVSKLESTEQHLDRVLKSESGATAGKRIDEIDSLRSHVVSLATALERSENNRADAINRLVAEREKHAHSLRCMTENVKRFYSTVTHGEA